MRLPVHHRLAGVIGTIPQIGTDHQALLRCFLCRPAGSTSPEFVFRRSEEAAKQFIRQTIPGEPLARPEALSGYALQGRQVEGRGDVGSPAVR